MYKIVSAGLCAGALLMGAEPSFAQKAKDTLCIAANDQYSILHPYDLPLDEASPFYNEIYSPLMVLNEHTGKYTPELATSWKRVDEKTLEFELRDDIKFSNGKPLTTKALTVGAVYMKTAAGAVETVASSLAIIETVTAISDTEAEIRLKQPDATFPYRLAMWRLPEPDAWEIAAAGKDLPVGIGTGPFAFTSIDAAGAKLKANRTSWQPPKVDAMEARVLPEGVARAQAVLSGGMDIAMAIDRGDVDDIRAAGGSAQVRFTARMPYFAFVTQDAKAPINDVRVRLAMNYAVDRDKIIKSMMPPGVKSSAQLAMTGAVGFVDDLKPFTHDQIGRAHV